MKKIIFVDGNMKIVKRKKRQEIKVAKDESPPILLDERTGKYYPVKCVRNGLRLETPFKK